MSETGFKDVSHFRFDLIPLEACQSLQAHGEDLPGLDLCQLEALYKRPPGSIGILGAADEGHDFVDVVDGYREPFQDVEAVLGLF